LHDYKSDQCIANGVTETLSVTKSASDIHKLSHKHLNQNEETASSQPAQSAGSRLRAFILGNNSKHVNQPQKSENTTPRGNGSQMGEKKREVLIDLSNMN
jgi:hypothetical protein